MAAISVSLPLFGQVSSSDAETELDQEATDQSQFNTPFTFSSKKLQFTMWTDLAFGSSFRDRSFFFDQHHVYLIGQSQVTEALSGYAEIEFEHGGNPSEGGEVKIERAYGEYAFQDYLKLRFGKFLNAFGLWNRFHWEPLTVTVSRPLAASGSIIPFNGTGAALLGSFFFSDFELNYTFYTQNGQSAKPDTSNDNKVIAGGNDLYLEYDEAYRIGISTWFDQNELKNNRKEQVYLVYSRLKYWRLRLDLEYLIQEGDLHLFSYYLQPGLKITDYLGFYYRFSYLSIDEVFANGKNHLQHIASIVVQPVTQFTIKLEYFYDFSEDFSLNHNKGLNFNVSVVF